MRPTSAIAIVATLFISGSALSAQGGGAAGGGGGRGAGRGGAPQPGRVMPDTPRPIEAGTSLWAEELTFMEIRDLVKAGTTTIIIGTGGVEQNGPYVAGGKHNFVLTTVMPYIARKVGNALIAPIVKFVPEGRHEPASGHMAYAGTISLEQSTYEAVLRDILRSYRAHGFIDLVLIGDSGGNQTGMRNAADSLNKIWMANPEEKARVHFLPEYYDEDRWSWDYLRSLGYVQIDTLAAADRRDARVDTRNGMHDDIYYESQIAVQNVDLVRVKERMKANGGKLTLHTVDLKSPENLVEIGKKLAEYRAGITAKALEASRKKLRP
jgi:creatinine amidohydrolase